MKTKEYKFAGETFYSRTVTPKDGKPVVADHIMGSDFAKSSFLMNATYANRRMVVVVYANVEKSARDMVTKEGFTDITDLVEYEYIS